MIEIGRHIVLGVMCARSYLDVSAHRILFYAAAEIFVSPAAQGTFNPYSIVHDGKHFINRCNYLAVMISPA